MKEYEYSSIWRFQEKPGGKVHFTRDGAKSLCGRKRKTRPSGLFYSEPLPAELFQKWEGKKPTDRLKFLCINCWKSATKES